MLYRPALSTGKAILVSAYGGSPAAVHLSCFAKKVCTKEGDPPAPALRASLGFPKRSGGCGTRALRSDNRSRRPPIFLENRGGAEGEAGGVRSGAMLFTSAPLSSSLPEGERAMVPSPSRGRLGWGWGVWFEFPLIRRRAAQPVRGQSASTV